MALGMLAGKAILVTGATSGIGRATAIGLADEGAQLLLVGRTPERIEETRAEIRRRTGRDDAVLLRADLSSKRGVRALADEVKARVGRLDVLVNNAGVTLLSRQTTEDGLEATFATNHLAYFLLTGLLLPLPRDARLRAVEGGEHPLEPRARAAARGEHRHRELPAPGRDPEQPRARQR